MQNYFFYGFGLLVAGILTERIVHRGHYDCHGRAFAYNIGNYLNIFLMLVYGKVIMGNPGRRSSKLYLSLTGLAVSVVFQVIWNVFGLFWMFDAAVKRTICLSFLDLFVSVVFQILTLLAFAAGVIYLVVPFFTNRRDRFRGFGLPRQQPRFDPEQIKEMFVRKNLVSIYAQRAATSKATIHDFLSNPNNQGALQKIALLNEEKALIRRFYLKAVDEQLLAGLLDNQEAHCTICMVDYQLEDPVVHFSCNHCYHEACCANWLRVKISCPTCRASIRKDLILRVTKDPNA